MGCPAFDMMRSGIEPIKMRRAGAYSPCPALLLYQIGNVDVFAHETDPRTIFGFL
jgi:hypothetical protein